MELTNHIRKMGSEGAYTRGYKLHLQNSVGLFCLFVCWLGFFCHGKTTSAQ